jgi:hypothetical protein
VPHAAYLPANCSELPVAGKQEGGNASKGAVGASAMYLTHSPHAVMLLSATVPSCPYCCGISALPFFQPPLWWGLSPHLWIRELRFWKCQFFGLATWQVLRFLQVRPGLGS